MLNTHALLQMVVSAIGCRHQWSQNVSYEQRSIVCVKCGLYAYLTEPRWREEWTSTLKRKHFHEEPTAGAA